MPASQFDEAFALLEQSFKDANFLQAYKALPSRQTTEKADSPTQPDFSDNDDSDDSDASMHQGYRPRDAPAISLMRSNSTLPPTPPTHSRDTSAAHPHLVPLPKDSAGIATPPNQQKPPTPDLTPPTIRDKDLAPPRPGMPHHSSSRAESFITARENQSQTSAHTSQSSLPLRSEAGRGWLDATRSMRLGGLHLDLKDRQKQLQEYGSESGETTPTQETERGFLPPPPVPSKLVEYITPEDLDGDRSSTPESPGTQFARNVTIRKKRACNLQQQTTPNQKVITSHRRTKSVTMSQSEGSTESPSTIKDGETLDWPEIANDHLYKQIRDEKSKRLSNASNTSTVVEAIVLASATRQQKQPALRRVSGVDTLRDGASSKRSSIDSTNALQHRLKHRVSPLPGRKHLVDDRFDATRSVSNPEARRSDKTHNGSYRHKHHVSPTREPKDDGSLRLADQEQVADRSWLDDASPDPFQHQSRTRLRHVSAPIHRDDNSTIAPSKDSFRRLNGVDAKLNLGPKQGWKRHSLDAELESPEHEHPPRLSIDQTISSKNSSSRKQNNPSTSLYSSPRKSSDTRDGRQLHSSNTPISLSQLSDRTDSMEVNEAKAVNLYPHDNTSLLMIQHVAKKRLAGPDHNTEPGLIDELLTPESEGEQARGGSRPVFKAVVDAPDTPPTMNDTDGVEFDSPLRNPRAAPQPPKLPAIIFSPATPMSEIGEKPSPEREDERPSTPRRPSLVEKARRYSENLIQPFLPRTLSRRSISSTDRPTSAEDRHTTLHPFWRPRGFWDDFESDEEDYEDEPLPLGGDTSDVRSLKSIEQQRSKLWNPRRLSVRLPGFRGTGGFLMGNSLGIDRHGTNVRRPHVNLTTSSPSTTDTPRPTFLARLLPLPTLRKRKSTDLLRAAAQSTESLRRLAQRQRKRRFRELDARFGVTAFRAKVKRRREVKQEAERERLREGLKLRIGSPVYVET